MAIYQWCLNNKIALFAILGCISHVATILNTLVPASTGPAWMHAILGRLATLDKQGNWSTPLISGNAGTVPVNPTLLIALLAGCLLSCAAAKQYGVNVGTCALNAIPSAVSSLVPQVETLISSSATDANVQTSLEGLGVQYGIDVVTCAVQVAITELFAKFPRTATGSALDMTTVHAIRRAQVFLLSKHVVPVVK